MKVGFWKSNVSIMLKGQSIFFFICCILCLKDGVNFSFATSTNTPSSVFPAGTYTLPRALVRGITSKVSPLPTVSYQVSFRPWAAASANVITTQVMLCASFPAFSTTINSKQNPHHVLSSCPSFSGPTPEADFSQATEEVKSSDSLTSLPQPFK